MNGARALSAAAREPWDVVVVGAGPAGAFAARAAARRRLRVLLVDRARFPRHKVCGCCLNGRALSVLDEAGLGELVSGLGARPLRRFEVRAPGVRAELELPRGAAVSRRALDAALARAAVESGVEFLDGVHARLGPAGGGFRTVGLERARADGGAKGGQESGGGKERAAPVEVGARLVLAADGLAGSLLAPAERRRAAVARGARIGVGAHCPEPPEAYRPGTIHMAVGRWGYVGLVRIEGGALDVAAALDPERVRGAGGPGAAVAEILSGAGLPPVGELRWRGTPPLTRTAARPAFERVLLLGDAAAYVEPFTGEGIGWALSAASAVTPFVERAAERWEPAIAAGWRRELGRLLGRDRVGCRLVARGLRSPRLTRLAIRALALRPRFARTFVERLNTSPVRGRR